jgi:hypothetical protein
MNSTFRNDHDSFEIREERIGRDRDRTWPGPIRSFRPRINESAAGSRAAFFKMRRSPAHAFEHPFLGLFRRVATWLTRDQYLPLIL